MIKKAPIWTVLWMMLVTVGIVQAQAGQPLPPIPPEAVGWVEGVAYAVAVRDNYAFVGFGSDFTVVDVSDKTTLVVVATLPLPETIKEIHLAGNVAFVVLDMGLWTIDVTNPVASTMLGSYLYPGLARIVVRDSYVYGTSTIYLLIWDVSDPSNPSLLSITQPEDFDSDWIEDLAVEGTIAYLMNRESPVRSWAIDVSNPHTPVQLSSWAGGAISMVILGTTLYEYDEICTHYCTVWISGWDISDIYEPIWLGNKLMAPVYKSLFSYTMKEEGVHLYVGTDAAVFAYLPAQPAENGQVVMSYPLAHVRDLAVSQGYLWVASEQGLIIFEDLPRQKAFLPVHLR